MPDKDAIVATVERYVAAFGDRDAYVGCFAPDATLEDPVGSPARRGHDEIGQFWDDQHGLADAVRLELTGSVRVASGEAAFPMRAIVTLGGNDLALPIIDVMTFDDDARITSMRAFFDMADLAPHEA